MAATGLYVTGTDTGVGKTAVAVAIAHALRGLGARVGVYKPVASGIARDDPAGDAARLWEAAGRPRGLGDVCPQAFAAAISPPRSAAAEGRLVDEGLLRTGFQGWLEASDVVVVEGAGGLLSPLGTGTLNADLARDLGLPLVVVDAARLGAIGRTLATVEAARARGLSVAAVVLSHTDPPAGGPADPASPWAIARDSAEDLAGRLVPVPVTALGHGGHVFEPPVDWRALAGRGQAASGHGRP